MKRIYFFIIMVYLSQSIFAQVIDDGNDATAIAPDDVFFWDTEHDEWDLNSIDKDHYRFYNLGGEIYVFRGRKDGDLLLYQHHSKTGDEGAGIDQVTKLENNGDNYAPLYDPVAFDYNGVYHAFYYSVKTISETVPGNPDPVTLYHPLYFGKHFYTTGGNITEWNAHGQYTSKSEYDKRKLYRGAIAIGNYIYLVYDSYFRLDELSDDPSYDELYYYDDHVFKIDVCTMNSNNELELVNTHELTGVTGNGHHHPRAIDGFVHPDGHVRLLISYSGESTNDKENYGGGVILYSFANHGYMHLYHNDDFAYSVRAVHGSLKGDRTKDDIHRTAHPNRIQVLYNHFENHTILGWKDEGEFYYKTFAIDADEHKYYLCDHGQIQLSNDEEKPDEWNRMAMDVTTRITAHNNKTYVKGSDTFEKDIWLFHTDNDGYIYGDIFTSDNMQVLEGSLNYTDDLDNTEKYGDSIRSLWSLIGITDGAPPCAIDWDTWGFYYDGMNIEPTELTFLNTIENEITQSDSYERTFYTETGVKAIWGDEDDGLSGGVHASFKFFNTIRRENTVTFTKEVEIEQPFALCESTQKNAFEIWSVPNIHRVSFANFSWWDNDLEHKIKGSVSHMFFCNGNKMITDTVPIANMPYGIADPNNPEMKSWHADSSESRGTVVANAAIYNVDNLCTSYRYENGQEATFTTTNSTSNRYEHTHGFEVKFGAEAQYKVPEVFQLNIENEEGFEWQYEITTEHTSSISNAFKVSLQNLTDPHKFGILVDELDITTYFFTNNEESSFNYWYYDYFNPEGEKATIKPWYIAHVVTSSHKTELEEELGNQMFDSDKKQPYIFPTILSNRQLKVKSFDDPVQELRIYGLSGELVFSEKINSLPNEIHEIFVNDKLASGAYLAKLMTKDKVLSQKLVVE